MRIGTLDRHHGDLRILVTTQWLGGDGGMERAVASILTALEDHEIDVLAAEHIRRGYFRKPALGRAPHRLRWRRPVKRSAVIQQIWAAGQPIMGFRGGPYDLHLHFWNGANLFDLFSADVRVLIPAGAPAPDTERQVDAIWMEAPSNVTLVRDVAKAVVMPPPLLVETSEPEPVPSVSGEFVLTVFNPHGRVKGSDLLASYADRSRFPVVWCHGTATRSWDVDARLLSHPKIVHVVDATRGQLRWLYEQAACYLSLSRSEGFGWAIADALQYGVPIISRDTGVLTVPGLDLRQVQYYEDHGGLFDLAVDPPLGKVDRDLSALRPDQYERRVLEWLDASRSRPEGGQQQP